MKTINIITTVSFIFLWVACSQEVKEFDMQSREREVSFRIEKNMTKVLDTEFAIGDSIGIFAVKRVDQNQIAVPGNTGNQAHNVKWVKTEEGWQPASLADKIVYPQDGAKLDFYAYFPYNRDAVQPNMIHLVVKSAQNNLEGLQASDIMVAYNRLGSNEGEVELVFSHVLSMVDLKISEDINPADIQVQMADILVDAYLDLATDQLTNGSTYGAVNMLREENEAVFRAYVPAQSIMDGTALFRCMVGEKIYIYTTQGVEFIRGHRLHFDLSLK